MSLFDATQPADTEAVRLGASRIREVKVNLNSMLGQIFSDPNTFLTGWITSSMLAALSVQAAAIDTGAVTTDKLANNVLSVATGRPKVEDGFVTSQMLDASIQLPSESIGSLSLAPGSVVSSVIASGAVGLAQVASGIAKIHIGTYNGNSNPQSITGVGFKPDMLLTCHKTADGICIGFRVEDSGSGSNLHRAYTNSGLGAQVVTWDTDGFTLTVGNQTDTNVSGQVYSYIALKV